MEKDRPLRLKRWAITMVALGMLLATFWAVAHWPSFVEHVYARRVSAVIVRGLSTVTGLVPVSLAEFALLGVVLYLLVPFVVATVHVVRRQRRIGNAIASGVLRALSFVALVTAWLYLSWGLNYTRAPLAARLGWPPVARPADDIENRRHVDEIAVLTRQLIEAANANYRTAVGREDLGRPSEPPAGAPDLDLVLDSAYQRVQQSLALEPAFALARGRAKALLGSEIMNHLQLGGFYFPWTAEANYNRLMPPSTLPQTVAHEKAHQRGIALEDEANFIGFLACAMSDDAYTRYAGYLFAQRQLLSELSARDLARARTLVGLRLAGVQRDVDYIRAFWQQYEGRAARVSERVNNTYLKSQGETRGVAAYAASRSLIVLFARHNGGSAVVAAPATSSAPSR